MVDQSVTNTIVAALKGGNAEEAEHYCRAALAQAADDPQLLLLLALSLRIQGRDHDALAPLTRLTELQPQDSGNWTNYATALQLTGNSDAARDAAARAVAVAPDERDTLEQLGQWCSELGAPNAAVVALQRALKLDPDSAKLRVAAARARVATHDLFAGEALRDWRNWPALTDELRLELADLLSEVSEPWDALEILQELVARKPTDWHAQLLLAKLCERVNQPAQAEVILDWVEAMQAAAADAEWSVREARVQRAQLALRAGDAVMARRLLELAGPAGDDDASYYFLLGKICDRLGERAAALTALAEAHRRQLVELRMSRSDLLEPGAALLPGVDARVTADEYRAWPALRAPDTAQSPVFVVGFPRSGTTLLEQMLDAHPQLQSMDERPFLNILASQLHDFGIEVPHDLARLDQRGCDELRKGYVLLGCGVIGRNWNERLVDKNPLNLLWLPLLHRIFPHAKVILAVRHPCDVIWSCYLQNFRSASLQSACRSLPHLARAYVAAMECWLHHAALFQLDAWVSRYEDLVADPHRHAQAMAGFLGLTDAAPLLDYAARAREKGFIKTPSYTQVVQPINARSIGHWQHYPEAFAEVLPIVQPLLEHWGYTAPAHAGG